MVELKVLRCELAERIATLKEKEGHHAHTGRWNLRRELKEQRHRAEVRLAEVERRLEAMGEC